MKLRLPLIITVLVLPHIALYTPKTLARSRSRYRMDKEKAAEYQAAAPLNHIVRIERSGSYLMINYELIGKDGKKYNLWQINDKSRPAFAIYKGDDKVGGGTFEFG
jgi:hypothetical protein